MSFQHINSISFCSCSNTKLTTATNHSISVWRWRVRGFFPNSFHFSYIWAFSAAINDEMNINHTICNKLLAAIRQSNTLDTTLLKTHLRGHSKNMSHFFQDSWPPFTPLSHSVTTSTTPFRLKTHLRGHSKNMSHCVQDFWPTFPPLSHSVTTSTTPSKIMSH